ncbi:MAG: hypothetical protein ACRCV0_04910 [Brevinema sp.]
MKLLILLLLISSNGFAQYKKVKEINGLKIPKGIVAKYDKLENRYYLKFKRSLSERLDFFSLRINIINAKVYPIISFEYWAHNWLFVHSATIYIKNPNSKILTHHLKWSDSNSKNTDVQNGWIFERYDTTDKNAILFLIQNSQKNSEITIRFHGKEFSSDKKLEKKDVSQLINMLQFYKTLSEKP